MRSLPLSRLRFTLLAAAGLGTAAGCGSSVDTEATSSGTNAGGGGGSTTTGAGSGGGTTTTTGAGNGGGVPGKPCEGAVPVSTTQGADSGFVKCPDGTLHRVAAVACEPSAPACDGTEATVSCASDADCTQGPNGRCAHREGVDFGGPTTECGCVYPCANDAECGAGRVCVCPGVLTQGAGWPSCADASCVTSADCASGECGIGLFNDGCDTSVELACRAPTDACRVDSDCAPGQQCTTADGDAAWTCRSAGCAIGRPLLVDGQARSAATVARGDWAFAELRPSLDGLGPELRAALAEHWRRVAALEHASVGSFARFSLQLLTLGAPPEFLAEAQRAALDEIEHARLAYAFASAYADRPLGPGALDGAAAPIPVALDEVLASLVEEACVGETVGVAEALHLAAVATDPALARVHARIAEDETRHAELAWRVLGWALTRAGAHEGAGEGARQRVADAFDRAAATLSAPPAEPRVASRAHGLLSSAELLHVRKRALREVVLPCARALLQRPPAKSAASSAGATTSSCA